MSKKIAITGGIGSGKSTVCEILKKEGYPVFSCDEIYKEIINLPSYIQEIKNYFPDCVIEEKIDKNALSKTVFADKAKRERLNSIAHPLIMQSLFQKMNEQGGVLSFAEVPLLFEGNYQNLFDEVLIVARNREDRIRSVSQRDNLSPQQVEKRILSQADYSDENLYKGHFLISNDGDETKLRNSVLQFLKKLS